MCALRVTLHIWRRYSSSYHRRVNGRTYCKYVPQLSRDLADLKARVIAAVKNIDAPMLTRVWQELKYCNDVCRFTRGAHIEHL
jgi:hypothetical protein